MIPKCKMLKRRTRFNKFRKAEAQARQNMPIYGETGNYYVDRHKRNPETSMGKCHVKLV